jgi:hypothetical protein
LERYYRKYKDEFGSIRQSIRFFKSLSSERQETLIKKIEVKDTESTIENLSKYLYEVRSKFVHESKLILNMSGRTTIGRNGKKIVICKLSIEDLMKFFEEGLVMHFKCQET